MNHFKKTNKSLGKLRTISFQLGIVIACGLTLVAFEWKSPTNFYIYEEPGFDTTIVITDLPPITYQDVPVKPKVKLIQPSKIIDIIEIIDVSNPNENNENNELPDFEPDDSEPISGTKTPPPPKVPFTIVEKMPKYVGGEKARMQFLAENVKYPRYDKASGIEGTVHLQFVVTEKGEITNIKILRGVSELIDKEAIRVLKAMPKWSPGEQRKRPVNVMLTMPIKFELR